MRILDILKKEEIKIGLIATEKSSCLAEMLDILIANHKLKSTSKDTILKELMAREELGSTGIGQGVAIPHTRTSEVTTHMACFGTSRTGVDFNSLDGDPVYLVFLLLSPKSVPPEKAGDSLKILSAVSRLLKDKFFRQAMRGAESPEQAYDILKEENTTS